MIIRTVPAKVPVELYKRFRAQVRKDNLRVGDVVAMLIEQYIAGNIRFAVRTEAAIKGGKKC